MLLSLQYCRNSHYIFCYLCSFKVLCDHILFHSAIIHYLFDLWKIDFRVIRVLSSRRSRFFFRSSWFSFWHFTKLLPYRSSCRFRVSRPFTFQKQIDCPVYRESYIQQLIIKIHHDSCLYKPYQYNGQQYGIKQRKYSSFIGRNCCCQWKCHA